MKPQKAIGIMEEIIATTPFAYIPILTPGEQAAYRATWKILQEITEEGQVQLACKGARRTRLADRIAAIIKEEMKGVQG